MLKREEIRIRDPFILSDFEAGCYYMYGTTAFIGNTIYTSNSFVVYKSYDLESFEEPKVIFDGEGKSFWGKYDFWAPEVHKYNDKFYMFASCKADGHVRATQIFVCDTPDGKFTPLGDKPQTPEGWECLDGTLVLVDDTPYMVFCHEWLQVKNGQICAVELSRDLKEAVGEPRVLFSATDSPEVSEIGESGSGNYVTDGPFLYKEKGKFKMIWSTFNRGKYTVQSSECDTLFGKWRHFGDTFGFDGGHAMLFFTLEGERMIALHSPDYHGEERAVFYKF